MVLAHLVLGNVGIGTEDQGPSLDPCQCHETYGLGLINNVLERFAIRVNDKLSAKQVLMKSLYPEHNGQGFLVELGVFPFCH